MSNGMKKTTKQTGFITLITVIIVGAIIATTAVYLFVTGISSSKYSQGVAAGNNAKAAAAACAELALAAIQANPNLATPSNGSSTLDSPSNTSCSYTISGTGPNLTITANGTVLGRQTDLPHEATGWAYRDDLRILIIGGKCDGEGMLEVVVPSSEGA